MTRYGTPAVECYKYEGKEVGFARDVWLYLFFMLVAVVLYPYFWSPGRQRNDEHAH